MKIHEVHNILYVLICQNILSKNQKKKFIQDLRHLWSTGFELRRSNARSFRLFMFPLSRSWVSSRWGKDEAFTDSTHVLIPLRSNFIFKACFDPLPQRTLFSEWFCLRTNFVITAHQHTAGSFDVRFLSLRIYLYSRMKMEKQINF